MARTLSAPRRSGFAGAAVCPTGQPASLTFRVRADDRDPHRALLLIIAIALVFAGVAVPHLDDQSLSTLLFLAGTGLAAALVIVPYQSLTPKTKLASAVAEPQPTCLANAVPLPARFTELMARQTETALDRAQWAKLTAHMSHELRTPLNAVLGFSEMMSNEVFGPLGSSLYSSYARDIHASGRLLLKSAEDALAITALLTATADRKDATPASNLHEIVADALAFADYDLKARSIAVTTELDAGLNTVGEPQAMRQALINLLAEASSNAADGATILIKARASLGGVRLSIEVDNCRQGTLTAGNHFPLMLARTLCELAGAKLTCPDDTGTTRAWTIDLVATAQSDFFA